MSTDFVEFRQLQEVGIFSCLVYSLAKSHFMDGDLLGPECRVLGLKIFEPNGENPYLCDREQGQPEGFTVHVNCYVIFVCFG